MVCKEEALRMENEKQRDSVACDWSGVHRDVCK